MIELQKTPNGLRVNEREVPVMDFYDVVVIGGGVAGVAAGMAAGKRGLKTIILETFTAPSSRRNRRISPEIFGTA